LQNIIGEELKFSCVRRTSSFKISAPPDVLVIKEFVPNRRRTYNRPSTLLPDPKNGNVRGLNIKLPKFYVDSSAFNKDILAFTETWLKPEILDSEVISNNSTYRTVGSSCMGVGC